MKLYFNGETREYLTVNFGLKRDPWAPVGRSYHSVPNRPGVYMRKTMTIGQRTIDVPVTIADDHGFITYNELKEDLAAWLIHKDVKSLIFSDEPDRIYYAAVDGSFDPTDIVNFGTGSIPFVIPDGYKSGFEQSYPLSDYPIYHEGTVPSNPILFIKFRTTSTNYELSANGRKIKIIWNFKQNDELVIDTQRRKITINNAVKMTALDISSKWIQLVPGDNMITADQTKANITVTFSPKWH